MKSNLFNPDGQLAKSLSRTFDIIALSMCWLICSIPLLTPGLAWTSMYYAIDQYVLEGDPNCIKGFIKSMQENMKKGILIYLIVVVIGLSIAWSMFISYQMMQVHNPMGTVLFTFGGIILFLFFGYTNYVFPLISIYKYDIQKYFMVSFELSIRHIFTTILFSLMTVLFLVTLYYFWIVLFFLPATYVLIQQYLINRVLKQYDV